MTRHVETGLASLLKRSDMLLALTILIVFIFVSMPENAFALDPDFTGTIAKTFSTKAKAWSTVLTQAALSIFKVLLTIDIAWFGIRAALQRDDVAKIFAEFTRTILVSGFMLSVISYFGEWSQGIINGFYNLATQLGYPIESAQPGYLFGKGLELFDAIWQQISVWSPSTLGYAFAGIALVITFALMAAEILRVKCESYIVLNAGIIFLGLGGSIFTKDKAINFMWYAFSVGLKLFIMQLLVGIAVSFVNDISSAPPNNMGSVITIVGASIVLLVLIKSLPDTCASIISMAAGSGGGGALLFQAATAVATSTIAAAQAIKSIGSGGIGAAGAVMDSKKLAEAAGATGLGKMGHMAKNMAGAAWEAGSNSQKEPNFGGRLRSATSRRLEQQRMANESGGQNDDQGKA